MRGWLWSASYLVLSLTVLWLTLTVLSMYRTNGLARAANDLSGWPSLSFSPLEPLPHTFGEDVEGRRKSLFGGDCDFIFVLGRGRAHTLHATIFAARSVADAHHLGYHIGIERVDESREWISHLPDAVLATIVWLSPDEFSNLRLLADVVVGVVRRGRVRQCIAMVSTPEGIEKEMHVFLGDAAAFERSVKEEIDVDA